jgi:hypothetical protein
MVGHYGGKCYRSYNFETEQGRRCVETAMSHCHTTVIADHDHMLCTFPFRRFKLNFNEISPMKQGNLGAAGSSTSRSANFKIQLRGCEEKASPLHRRMLFLATQGDN